MSVISQQHIRMGDCDTAGIGYFPRLLALVDNGVEDWLAHTLAIDRAGLLLGQGLGLPTVDLQVEFTAPCRLGEILDIEIAPIRLGTRSIVLAVSASVAGAERFRGKLVQVLTILVTGTAHPWPVQWHQSISAQIAAPIAEADTVEASIIEECVQ